jgi:hypothetical protein
MAAAAPLDGQEYAPDLAAVRAYVRAQWITRAPAVWAWWEARPLPCWQEAHRDGLSMGLKLWQYPAHLLRVWEQAQALEDAWQLNCRSR